ncbi:uncharacterized protein LOC108478646 isoform X2 [Gossypium arboreum]|uniref:uncharacterized protein LOC108478646 isoform X2 n=1 Tax=Gossypium arboreum TaxID=29729 RepID=UPI0022F15406|nr:uncharacterized protein LOC108478646 isoform X2 [Gossypium arboreum]
MVAYPNPSPIIVNKPFYLPRDFLYPIHGVIVLSAFHHQPMCRRISLPSYRMTIKASPSTHTSRKPSSSTKETIFKHARTSAMVGSRMFSHRFWLVSYRTRDFWKSKSPTLSKPPFGTNFG